MTIHKSNKVKMDLTKAVRTTALRGFIDRNGHREAVYTIKRKDGQFVLRTEGELRYGHKIRRKHEWNLSKVPAAKYAEHNVWGAHVYMTMDDRGRCKIGRSGSPEARVTNLQRAQSGPITLIKVWYDLGSYEKAIHNALKAEGVALHGEHFDSKVGVEKIDEIIARLQQG